MVGRVEPRPLKYDPHGVDNPSHSPSTVGTPFQGLRAYRLISLEPVTTVVTFILIDRHRDPRFTPSVYQRRSCCHLLPSRISSPEQRYGLSDRDELGSSGRW